MARTHYDTLGLKRSATAGEIKSAYRKIVLKHHPDRSKDPRSGPIFLAATEAYGVLSDPGQKLRYDESLDAEAKRAAERVRQNVAGPSAAKPAPPSTPRPGWNPPTPEPRNVAEELQRLTRLFARGKHAEAERLAQEILKSSPRNAICYAVLGDIARMRGDINEAARLYAYSAQYEPRNPVYQRRYEELLNRSRVVEDRRLKTRLESEEGQMLAPLVGGVWVLISGVFVALSPEASVFHRVPPISTWTLGMPIALFLCGIGVGATLAMGNFLDRFSAMATNATGRPGPAAALGLVAIVNFWAAGILYLLLGAFQRAFNFSTTRLVLGVAVSTLALTLAAELGGRMHPSQVLLWGGNLIYLGALTGWLVADTFRGSHPDA